MLICRETSSRPLNLVSLILRTRMSASDPSEYNRRYGIKTCSSDFDRSAPIIYTGLGGCLRKGGRY